MSRRNRRAAKRQDSSSPFGEKVAATVGSLSALYLLPAVAQAGTIVHNPGPGPTLDLNSFFNTIVTWSVDGANPAFGFARIATSHRTPYTYCYTCIPPGRIYKTYKTATLFFQSAANGRGFVATQGFRLKSLSSGFLIGNTVAPYTWHTGKPAALARRTQATYNSGGIRYNVTPYFSTGTHLIGFRFLNPGDGNTVDFGWAHLSLNGTGAAAIQDWAYACGGAPIAAGDETSSTTSCSPGGPGGGTAPEPSSLALLALGAAGLAAFRRRKLKEPAAPAA